MSFRLDLSPDYLWPVEITIPTENGEESEPIQFKLRFLRVSDKEALELTGGLNTYAKHIEDDPNTEKGITPRQLCEQLITGWDDVLGPGDEPLEFTPSNLSIVLRVATVSGQIAKQWAKSLTGAPEGNSKGRPATSFAEAAQAAKRSKNGSRVKRSG